MNARKGLSCDYSIERRKHIYDTVKANEDKMSYTDIAMKLLGINYGILAGCRRSKWWEKFEEEEKEDS